jgi:AcrR family transcriptional regulator
MSGVRAERAQATRDAIMTAAERMFAEDGVGAVSSRQISEAAGQGNNTAVGYHFGTRNDLVRAIVRRRVEPINAIRDRMLAEIIERGDETDVRAWLACLVHPFTEHLDTLGSPTWFARFGAQVMTDPALRKLMIEEASSSPSLDRIRDGLNRCLPALPDAVHAERSDMTRQLLQLAVAERERALAEGTPTPRASWHDAATGMTDALVGLWLAPVTTP